MVIFVRNVRVFSSHNSCIDNVFFLCFGFEAACSKNKDDIHLMDFLVFCLSYFDHQHGSGLVLPSKRYGHAV